MVKVKGKVKWSPLCHEDVWGIGSMDPHYLDLGTSWR
jgi:hypothetical protein